MGIKSIEKAKELFSLLKTHGIALNQDFSGFDSPAIEPGAIKEIKSVLKLEPEATAEDITKAVREVLFQAKEEKEI